MRKERHVRKEGSKDFTFPSITHVTYSTYMRHLGCCSWQVVQMVKTWLCSSEQHSCPPWGCSQAHNPYQRILWRIKLFFLTTHIPSALESINCTFGQCCPLLLSLSGTQLAADFQKKRIRRDATMLPYRPRVILSLINYNEITPPLCYHLHPSCTPVEETNTYLHYMVRSLF